MKLTHNNNKASMTNKNTINRKKVLSAILIAGIVFLLAMYLYSNKDMFASLQNINIFYFLLMIILYVLTFLGLGFLNKMIIQKLDPNINTYEILYLQFINNFLNKILPKGGVAFRAMYLKQNYGLSYSLFLASFTGIVIISLASQALISLYAFLLIYLQTGLYNVIISFSFLSIFLGSLFIMVFKPTIPLTDNRILKYVRMLAEGWKSIVKNTKDVVIFFVISVLVLLIDALNMYVVFYALNNPIQYTEALVLSSLSLLLSAINITPDGLGVREGVYLYVASVLTLSQPQIVFGSLVQRAVSIIASMFFGGLSYLLLQNIQKTKQKDR